MARGRFPAESARQALVEAYGRKLGAVKMGAGYVVEQNLSNKFASRLEAMRAKYPNIDLESSAFWQALERRALEWWNTKAFRGPGQDW